LREYPCGTYNELMFVQVAVNVPKITGLFDYHLPDEFIGQVKEGCLVIVPFGTQTVQGLVVRLSENSEVENTRPILTLLDPFPVLTPTQFKLAEWLAKQSHAPLAQCLDLMLPPGLSQLADTLYTLQPAASDPVEIPLLQQRLIALLQKRGSLRGRQIDAALPNQAWSNAARALIRRGALTSQPVLPPPGIRPKIVRTVQLACPPEEARQRFMEVPGRAGSAASLRRQAIVEFLIHEPWPVECSWVYASSGGNLADLHRLAEENFVVLGESEVWRDPLAKIQVEPNQAPQLTENQQQVFTRLSIGINSASSGQPLDPFLLFGVTGSGKTEIYIRAVEETLQHGRQAIILVPEIALTPQTVRRFMTRFPGRVGLIHSRLSVGERYDTWRRARAGLLSVIVGPRSALFTPLPNLGLIVLDESHDDSYDQTQIAPAYHAVSAAMELGRLSRAVVILGSATPQINLYYRAQKENWPLLHLPDRILAHRQVVENQLTELGIPVPELPGENSSAFLPLPPVKIVDMRQELKAGNRSIFSRDLQEALAQVLSNHQQAILFLNRRGTSTYVFCRDCGKSLRCPRCKLPLTFHASHNNLSCHTCGYTRALPEKCPKCGSRRIRQYGAGTERVEKDLQELFPQARVLRWDAESTRQKDAHELIMAHFIHHQADFLIGTQMLSKGLDLPLVTLVGVILAEVGLNLPDFRAGERTFQLLTQVAGRAGRSPLGGRVILQTFQPEHPVIRFAAQHDYSGFYTYELAQRRSMGYPPFSHLLRIEFRRTQPEAAEKSARKLAVEIQGWIKKGEFTATEIIGPAPCYYSLVNGLSRWQIIIRGPQPLAVIEGHPLGDCLVEIDPPNLL
jgi:primosomal protein N' (replication factor Y) (superfamily II helicase)